MSGKRSLKSAQQELLHHLDERDLDCIDIDRNDYAESKERWRLCQEFSLELDRWPILASYPLEGVNDYPSLRQSRSSEWLLWNGMPRLIRSALLDDDSLPMMWLRGREITLSIPQALGCPLYDDPDAPPQVITNARDIETLANMTPSDISAAGACQETLKIIEEIQALLGNRGYVVSTTMTGGPFTIASMIVDNLLFFESVMINKEPLHRLVNLVTDVMIRYRTAESDVLNYPGTEGYSGFGSYQPGGLYRMWDASGMMVSPEAYMEWCVPYWQRLFAEFGGGARQLSPEDERYLPEILSTQGLRIIHPERTPDFDIANTVRMAHEKKVMVELNSWDTLNTVEEFGSWVQHIRRETGNPKTGISLMARFPSLDLAQQALERWKQIN